MTQDAALRLTPHWNVLLNNPIDTGMGALWGGLCVWSLRNLGVRAQALRQEVRAQRSFACVALATWKVFKNSVALLSSSSYVVWWAHEAKLISLARFFPLVQRLCFTTTLVLNVAESGSDLVAIGGDLRAIYRTWGTVKQADHEKWLACDMLGLAGHVCMAGWGALGIASAVTTLPLQGLMLGASALCGLGSMGYSYYLEQTLGKRDPKERSDGREVAPA